jgi:hypothetical protein
VFVSELDTDPTEWNGRPVEIVGEVIGDYGRRASGVWIQVNDDAYADSPLIEGGPLSGGNTGLGVRMPSDLFDETLWGSPGRYDTRGPILQVTGIFRYADAETGGDTFIEATEIVLLEPSRPLDVPGPDWPLVIGSTGAIVVGVALSARIRYRRLNPTG